MQNKINWLRVIGDVHGKHKQLAKLCKDATYSLCVGDVGFSYDYLNQNINPKFHKCILGNHDNYTTAECCKDGCEKCEGRGYVFAKLSKHFLKDFGIWSVPKFGDIFYVRGAWSIDQDYRTINVSWWVDEELTRIQLVNAIDAYDKAKPKFVVTHTCPQCIVPMFFNGSTFGNKVFTPKTEQALENMYHIHQPDIWIFGHFHYNWDKVVKHPQTGKETRFICLNELKYIDFPKSN